VQQRYTEYKETGGSLLRRGKQAQQKHSGAAPGPSHTWVVRCSRLYAVGSCTCHSSWSSSSRSILSRSSRLKASAAISVKSSREGCDTSSCFEATIMHATATSCSTFRGTPCGVAREGMEAGEEDLARWA